MNIRGNIKNNEEGQAMVEFALSSRSSLTLVFGIIQFGILFNHSPDSHRRGDGPGLGREQSAGRFRADPRQLRPRRRHVFARPPWPRSAMPTTRQPSSSR